MKKTIAILIFIFASNIVIIAHPHVFIETSITVCMDGNGIKKLEIKFTFDKIFSYDLIDGFDSDKNNSFNQAEISTLEESAFSNLENYDYFIHMKLDGKDVETTNVSNFYAEVEDDNIVSYSFDINLDLLVNEGQKVKIAAYDHSYFIDVVIDDNGIDFKNPASKEYKWNLIKDKYQTYYYGQIIPDCLVLNL